VLPRLRSIGSELQTCLGWPKQRVTTININSITYSRKYMAVNYWRVNLISNLFQLNSSSTLIDDFGIDKVIGLRSYDISSF